MRKSNAIARCSFVGFSLEQDVVEDVAQGENTLQLEVLIHYHQTVNARLANGVEDSVQSIVQRAGVDAREILPL